MCTFSFMWKYKRMRLVMHQYSNKQSLYTLKTMLRHLHIYNICSMCMLIIIIIIMVVCTVLIPRIDFLCVVQSAWIFLFSSTQEYQASLGNTLGQSFVCMCVCCVRVDKYLYSPVNFARTVPHGLLVFLPSYSVMNACLEAWRVSVIYWKSIVKYVLCAQLTKQKYIICTLLVLFVTHDHINMTTWQHDL